MTHFDTTTSKSTDLAICRSPKCNSALDLSGIGDSEPWEIMVNGALKPNLGKVSIACCPHAPNKCHSCEQDDCRKKYTNVVSCTAAALFSCCSPLGWIDHGHCSCKDTAYTCLPYGGDAADVVV